MFFPLSHHPFWLSALATWLVLSGQVTSLEDSPLEYGRDIDPILQSQCVSCHGPEVQENGLRLDSAAAVLLGGHNGPVVLPGSAEDSSLIHFVLGIEEGEFNRMPLKAPPLSAAQVDLLTRWIDQGALVPTGSSIGSDSADASGSAAMGSSEAAAAAGKDPTHWAFQPIRNPTPPTVSNRSWPRGPLDRFVLARLEREGLSPSPEADKRTLIRRLSLDLTGLPPTPEQVRDFLTDNRPEAYQEVVDRLLRSPHFGERWALPWLDLARYGDSDGYEQDRIRPWAYRYRDWVIDALNRDMPFDRFTIDQIAGDLVPSQTDNSKVATGFHRNTLINREGGTDREQFRFERTLDRSNTVATVWMGLTMSCAQCHDHKYDRISQREYYQFFSFFNDLEDLNIDAPLSGELGPYLASRSTYRSQRESLLQEYGVPKLQPAWEKQLLETGRNPGVSQVWDKAYDALLRDARTRGVARLALDNPRSTLESDPSRRSWKERDALTDHFIDNYRRVIDEKLQKKLKFKELRKKLMDLYDAYPLLTQAQTVMERETPRETTIHVRGQWNRKGVPVDRTVPAVLPSLPSGSSPDRLALARWLVSREHPLTSRVTVNRIWQELFGRGLVETSDDFGTRGAPPSHPRLLDWLAWNFMESDWRMKEVIRTMVTSATYRQSSDWGADLPQRDPSNRLLARQSRLRLKAELIRDSALAVSGLLEKTVGGPSIRPPQPKGTADITYAGSGRWEETKGIERYRRGLYIHRQRTTLYPFLQNFDLPDTTLSACRREVSNTPLQALNLLNDPVFVEAARTLAYRVLGSGGKGVDERLDYVFQLSLARLPSPTEKQRLKRYLDEQPALLNEEDIAQLVPFTLAEIDPARAAAWVGVGSILLNLDEFITRE